MTMFPLGPRAGEDRNTIDEKPKLYARLTSWRSFSFTSKPDSDSDSDPSRDWIKGITICSWIISVVLFLNILLTIIAAGLAYSQNGETEFAFASLYMGKCSVAKNWSTGIHLVINILSTALLGASNYCMQCLASPSREQVDEAHGRRTWVRIGIPNIWNLLRRQRGKRQILGWILFMTSVPIHLIYNSVIFFSLAPMEYTVLSAREGSLGGNISADFEECFLQNARVDLATYNDAVNESRFKSLSKKECIDTFAQDYVSGQSLLVLVTNDSISDREPMTWIGRGNSMSFEDKSSSSFSWLCDYDYNCDKGKAEQRTNDWSVTGYEWWTPQVVVEVPTIRGETYTSRGWMTIGHYGIPDIPDTRHLNDLIEQDLSVDQLQAELDDASNWVNTSYVADIRLHGYEPRCILSQQQSEKLEQAHEVDHCMVLESDEKCQLFFSLPICILVIGCNIIKLLCSLATARDARKEVFLTIGDAIASFLRRPDPTTAGTCLLSKPLVDAKLQNWQRAGGRGKKRKVLDEQAEHHPLPLRILPRKRWFQAASTARWLSTITIFICMLIPAIYVLRLGILDYNDAYGTKTIWDSGLGDPSAATILSGLDVAATTNGIFSMVLMANTPQILVSFAYFMYNGLLTCMLGAVEYDNYARDRKPLRVSWPRGEQRSTYYLSLPYRYSLPLLAVSAVLHWLVSQSLFFVEIIPFDQDGVREAGDEVVTCGYSPVAIIFAIVVAVCLLLASMLLGLRRFRSNMPLAAQCSAAISAACHPGTAPVHGDDHIDHAVKAVQWGEIPGIYHAPSPLTFSNLVDGARSDASREGYSGAGSGSGSGSEDQREILGRTELRSSEEDLRWSGAVESGFYHCGFTSGDVFEPSPEKLYI
ncbi:hypothetical protein BJX70DRAFT_366905 [Aspergillus crustosus]